MMRHKQEMLKNTMNIMIHILKNNIDTMLSYN